MQSVGIVPLGPKMSDSMESGLLRRLKTGSLPWRPEEDQQRSSPLFSPLHRRHGDKHRQATSVTNASVKKSQLRGALV